MRQAFDYADVDDDEIDVEANEIQADVDDHNEKSARFNMKAAAPSRHLQLHKGLSDPVSSSHMSSYQMVDIN